MPSVIALSNAILRESRRPPSPKLARLFLVRARQQLRDQQLGRAQEDCISAMGVSEQINDMGQLKEARRFFDSLRGAADIHFFLPHFKSIMDALPTLSRHESLSRLKALRFCLHSYQALDDLLHPTIVALLSNLQAQVERQVSLRTKPHRSWVSLFRRHKGYTPINNELRQAAEIKLSRFQQIIFQDYEVGQLDDFEEPEVVLTF